LETEGQRRSDNFEDRGVGAGRQAAAAGLPIALLSGLFRTIGPKGLLVLVVVVGIGYFLAPASVKHLFTSLLGGEPSEAVSESSPNNKTCAASPENGKACDFSRVVLASTEDVWTGAFKSGALPSYGAGDPGAYRMPTLSCSRAAWRRADVAKPPRTSVRFTVPGMASSTSIRPSTPSWSTG